MQVGFYSEKQVVELTTFSRTTIWRAVKAGTFPKPVNLSTGRKGWPRASVHQWLEEKQGRQMNAA